MNNAEKTSEDKVFKQDVKKMSYDDLMEAIRYLDAERHEIANRVHQAQEQNNGEEKIIRRV
jgi:hypothetical protein